MAKKEQSKTKASVCEQKHNMRRLPAGLPVPAGLTTQCIVTMKSLFGSPMLGLRSADTTITLGLNTHPSIQDALSLSTTAHKNSEQGHVATAC